VLLMWRSSFQFGISFFFIEKNKEFLFFISKKRDEVLA
jgi:hypothetical protein